MSSGFQGQFQEALREAELTDLKKHAEDIQSTVTDFSTFDPMANAEKDMGHAFGGPESTAPAETVVTRPVPTETAAAEPAAPLPAIDVPLPEPLPPPTHETVTAEHPVPAEPVQKQA